MEQYSQPTIEFTGPPPFDVWLRGERLVSPRRISPETVAVRLLIAGFGIYALTQDYGVLLTLAAVVLIVGLIVGVGVLEKKYRLTRVQRRHEKEAAPPSGTITSDGIRESVPPHKLTDWAQFHKWQSGADVLVLHTPNRRLVFAPSMFQNHGDWSSFQRIVQQYVKQHST